LALRYQWPIANNEARGLLLQRSADYQRTVISTNELARNISSRVVVALSALKNSALELEKSTEAVRFYRRSLDNEAKKYRLGMATLQDLIQIEFNLTNALLNEITARNKVASALGTLRFETGTLLEADQEHVSVGLEELTTVPLLDDVSE
jgi:outer membrane protein TolC